MNRINKEQWDERYKETEFAFGKEPNIFFKEWLGKYPPATILMPADGEGRNGVFAAKCGWKVTSFDLSVEGQLKALKLAKENNVTIRYEVEDLEELDFEDDAFDALGMIYAHFAAEKKSKFHKKLDGYLKFGGIIIFEAFSKSHLSYKKNNPRVGGPTDINMLYSKEEILNDFENYKILYLQEEEVLLNEGNYHIGKGSVVRFVGKKL